MSNEPPALGVIYDHADTCVELFARYLRDRRTTSKDLAEEQRARFNIWAANMGVFADVRASLDYRLRDSPDIQNMIVELLVVMQRNIERAINVENRELLQDEMTKPTSPSKAFQLLKMFSKSKEIEHFSQRSSSEILHLIEEIIGRLQRISSAIRKSSAQSRNLRAANFIEKDDEGYNISADFERHAIRMVQYRFNNATESICELLGISISLRRNRFLYRKRHQEKLAAKRRAPKSPEIAYMRQEEKKQHTPLKLPLTRRALHPHKARTQRSLALSSTIASAHDRAKYVPPQPVSVVSSVASQDIQFDYPPVPTLKTGRREVDCPYCLEPLAIEVVKDDRQWRRHVDNDIEPYVCLFEECKGSLEFYSKTDEWIAHMQQEHTAEWRCPVATHPSETMIMFHKKEDFEDHMNSGHAGTFTNSQLPLLVEGCVFPATRPFDICPFCNGLPENIADMNQKLGDKAPDLLPKHIAGHLKALAFMFLPPREDVRVYRNSGEDEALAAASNKPSRGSPSEEPSEDARDSTDSVVEPDVARMKLSFDEAPSPNSSIQPDSSWAEASEEVDWSFVPRGQYPKTKENSKFLSPQLVNSKSPNTSRVTVKATVKATGLNIWVSGEQSDSGPEVDVIAVQGLGAHPYYTWVGRQTPVEEVKPTHRHRFNYFRRREKNAQADGLPHVAQMASDTEEVMWLRDFLPDLIPNARIMTYSYESDWRRADVKTSLRKCGEQLLNVLLQNRSTEKEGRRPLVFIGHSLGGLIIKQALVLADHGDTFRNIRFSTAGIIFLGTPHQGSKAAVYDVWLAQAGGRDQTLLESLRRNSPALHEIARDFEASYSNADIVCFYGNKDASYGSLRTQFVDYQSASFDGKRAIYLDTDHSGLNKFRGPDDKNFLLVQSEIQRIVQTAPSKIEERYRLHPEGTERESFRVDFSLLGIPVVKRFVARDAEMTRLTQALLPTSTDQMRRKVFILHGLGGIGKTQLSVEFSRKYQGSYSAVFWIDGSSKERLGRSIADLASRLPQSQLSEGSRTYSRNGSANVDEVIEDVLKWLSRPANDQWLLIFDNVDREFSVPSRDPEAFDVKKYFPTADQGSILITSRLASLWRLGTDIKLEPVNDLQGESILENSLGRSTKDSLKLVNLLQGLPLAINQAGSYMRKTGTNVSEYIELYHQAWARLMEKQHLSTLRGDADRSILTTWTLSFNSLRSQSEDAANLLMLWAFLDNRDLWYELLAPTLNLAIADEVPRWFARCAGDKLEFKECIGLLLEYSFIDAKTESSSFSMHSVLHHWCFYTFEEDKAIMSWLAVIIVASAVPSEAVLHYSLIQRRLLPHCDHVYSMLQRHLQEAFKNREYLPSLSIAFHQLGLLYQDQGKMEEAEATYLRALAGYEKAWGPEHTSTLNTINNLGNLYKDQGKMKEAEAMYLRALAGKEKAWGLEHTSTLDTVNNLGNLYKIQGKMKQAEGMYLRALAGHEKAWGLEHASTLKTVNNLGNLYLKQGKMKEAEAMYLRALIGYEKAWGPEHTATLNTVNNLGNLYSDQGKMKEAEDMYLRALIGYEKAWGPEHKHTLDTRYNLGLLYKVRPMFGNAVQQFELVVQGYTKLLGPEHGETVKALNQLENCKVD